MFFGYNKNVSKTTKCETVMLYFEMASYRNNLCTNKTIAAIQASRLLHKLSAQAAYSITCNTKQAYASSRNQGL